MVLQKMGVESILGRSADNMGPNEVAALLVKLYGEYKDAYNEDNDNYAIAVGIAIRMLSD